MRDSLAGGVNRGSSDNAKRIMLLLIVMLGLVGVALALVSTSRYGVGLSPDSTRFVSVARNLLAGRGFVCYQNIPYTRCPPLFPVLLAGIGLTGIDPAVGARLLNAVAFGGIVFTSGMFFFRHLRSKALVVIATCWVLLSFGLLSVCAMAWTEPVFVLLIVLFLLQMLAFLRHRRIASLVATSILASLCLLTRYPGVTVLVPGAILLLSLVSGSGISSRLKHLGLFLGVSCTPLGLYCVRNYLLTGMLTGFPRLHSMYTIGENVATSAHVATAWFLSPGIPAPMRAPILAALLLLALGTLLVFHRRAAGDADGDCLSAWLPGLVMLTYIPLILYTHQVGVLNEAMNDRYLAPVAVLCLWFLFVGIDRLALLLGQARGKAAFLRPVVIGACALWLVCNPLRCTTKMVRAMAREGAGGYSTSGWQESPLVKWLRDHRLEGPVRSNLPAALYALTGMASHVSPPRSQALSDFRASLASAGGEYLVWFRQPPTNSLHNFESLVSELFLEEVVALSDGGVYRLQPAPDSAFPESRIFSRCLVNGRWHSRFSDEESHTGGTVSSWILQADGTMESHWRLRTADGTVIDWHASGAYACSNRTFQFHSDGIATEKCGGTTSPYHLDIQGTVEGETATGTYCLRFANGQWPAVSRGSWRADLACPIYRVYSRSMGTHFYTVDALEVANLTQEQDGWISEGIGFYAYLPGRQPPDARPVHRFGSVDRDKNTQFFTMDEAEKDRRIKDCSHVWRYEGAAFYAYSCESHPSTCQPVYWFSSPAMQSHFYTIQEVEKNSLTRYPQWIYQGISWYALPEAVQ